MTANVSMQSPKVITIRQTQTCCPGQRFHSLLYSNKWDIRIVTKVSTHLPDCTAPHRRRRISS